MECPSVYIKEFFGVSSMRQRNDEANNLKNKADQDQDGPIFNSFGDINHLI